MRRTLVIATRNRKKFEEMSAILASTLADLVSLGDLGITQSVPETGDAFEDNARLKALGYARLSGQWALADDSGLEVDALGGRPGVRSSRWGGREGDDALNNRTLLESLAPFPQDTWSARYRCVIVVATPEKVLAVTEGACEGRITDRAAGANGFGYDPYFWLAEYGCTMAELDPLEKNRISHRGQALESMKKHLEKLL
jgi:XTP/dITP diphosphohydrolase